MSRCRCRDTALCAFMLFCVVGVLDGCGDDTTASTAPTISAVTQAAADSPPVRTSAERQDAIHASVSDYLSKIIDVPSSVRESATATATMNKLASEVHDAPSACKTAVRKVSQIIVRTDLSSVAKRKRVLDAMLSVYGDC